MRNKVTLDLFEKNIFNTHVERFFAYGGTKTNIKNFSKFFSKKVERNFVPYHLADKIKKELSEKRLMVKL